MWHKNQENDDTQILNALAAQLDKCVNNFIQESLKNLNISLNLTHVAQLFIQFYGYQNKLNTDHILYQLLQLNDKTISQKNFDVFKSIIQGKNILGKILLHENLKMREDITSIVLQQFNQQKENIILEQYVAMISNVINYMLKPIYDIQYVAQQQVQYKNNECKANLIRQYLIFYKQYLIIKQQRIRQIVQQKQDEEKLKKQQIILAKQTQIKKYIIQQLYDKYIMTTDPFQQYNLFQLICQLQQSPPHEITTKYKINDLYNAQKMTTNIQMFGQIASLEQFDINTTINQQLDNTCLTISFTDTFTPTEMQNEDFLPLFENLENRLQFVHLKTEAQLWLNIILFHQINSDEIGRIEQHESWHLNDDAIYDIIINGEASNMEILQQLKTRYLSIVGQKNVFRLQNINYLVSLSLVNAKMENISQCTNLKNIYSSLNTYEENDISSLRKLVRIFSCDDTFQSQKYSMLEILTQISVIEYVSIFGGNNTIGNVTIEKPLPKLRCLLLRFAYNNIDEEELKNMIIIDTKSAQLDNIQFLNVENGNIVFKYNIQPLNLQKQQSMMYIKYLQQKYKNNILPAFYLQMQRIIDENNYNQSVTDQIIVKLFEQFRKQNPSLQYAIYSLIQELKKCNINDVLTNFNLNTHEILTNLNAAFDYAENISQLRIQGIFSRFGLYYSIKIRLNSQFSFENIQDSDWVKICDNYMYSLQNIVIKDYDILKSFIIIRRVYDNKIYKQSFISDTFMLQFQSNDVDLYDVVIFSDQAAVTGINKLKIRCLHYYQMHQRIYFKLQHPKCLTHLSVCNVKINNFSECSNLCSLFNSLGDFRTLDFKNIKLLKKIVIIHTECENPNNCLINYIVKQNKLEYIGLYNCKNVINMEERFSVQYLENLKFIDILNDKKQVSWMHFDRSQGTDDLVLNNKANITFNDILNNDTIIQI